MRRLLVVLVGCGAPSVASTPTSTPVEAAPEPTAPERPIPFPLPEGADTLSSSTVEGVRSVALSLGADEATAAAWARATLARLGCRDVADSRPWEELELRCKDQPATSAVVAHIDERTTVVVTWADLPAAVDVGE